MKTYKIVYWNNGNILVKKIDAKSKAEAEYLFYMTTACDDIKTISEIKSEK